MMIRTCTLDIAHNVSGPLMLHYVAFQRSTGREFPKILLVSCFLSRGNLFGRDF